MRAGVNSVNSRAVNGEARSQNRYLTRAIQRNSRRSAGTDYPLRVRPFATLPLKLVTFTLSQAFMHAHASSQKHKLSALTPTACKVSLLSSFKQMAFPNWHKAPLTTVHCSLVLNKSPAIATARTVPRHKRTISAGEGSEHGASRWAPGPVRSWITRRLWGYRCRNR